MEIKFKSFSKNLLSTVVVLLAVWISTFNILGSHSQKFSKKKNKRNELTKKLFKADILEQELNNNAVDPDLPNFFHNGIDKETYLQLRAQHIQRLRGFPHKLSYDPHAKAIKEMQQQEKKFTTLTNKIPWTSIGPAPIPNGRTEGVVVPVSGRISSIAVHPKNLDIVYVGVAGGGVYRTLNGGKNWTPIFDNAQVSSIGALTLLPTNPTTLFVGTGEAALSGDSVFGVGVYRIDNAETSADLIGPFNKDSEGKDVFTGRSISRILIHPTDPNIMFVSTASGVAGIGGVLASVLPIRGIYRTTNALSATPFFTKLNVQTVSPNRSITDMIFEPENPSTLICNVFGTDALGDGGIWRTTNALEANPVFAQTLQGQIRAEFAANKIGISTTILAATGEVDKATGCTSSSAGVLRRSKDSGATWSDPITSASGYCSGQCFYDIAVAIDPKDANAVYIGGQATSTASSCKSVSFAKSTDGVNFSSSEVGLHADTHVIIVSPSNSSIIYTGNDGGIFRSNDKGTTWTSLNNSSIIATQFQSLALHPLDKNFLIGGTQDNGTNFFNSNRIWRRADFGDGGFSLIDQTAKDTTNVTMYHTYFNATDVRIGVARVTNVNTAEDFGWNVFGCSSAGTNNGIDCKDSVLFYAPIALGPGDPNTLYFGTDRLYRSINRGETMTVVSQQLVPPSEEFPSSAVSAIGISRQNDKVRIVGTEDGKVFATTTGSSTLTDITGLIPKDKYISRSIIDPENANTAYIALCAYGLTPGQHIWKTTNLDANSPTWIPSSAGIPDVPINAFVVDPTNTNNLYAGTDIGVFNSTDGGKNWTPFSNGLPRVPVFDMAIQNPHRILRIATHGRGIWETPILNDQDTLSPTVIVKIPNGGEVVRADSQFTIDWSSKDDVGIFRHSIELSVDGGTTFSETIATDLSGSAQSFTWLVPKIETTQARIRVMAIDAGGNTGFDISDANFSILEDSTFSLVPSDPVLAVKRGKTSKITININRTGGFTGKVTVIAPTSIKFTPVQKTTKMKKTTFSFKVKKATPVGTQELIFTGKDETGRTHTTTVTLTIQ